MGFFKGIEGARMPSGQLYMQPGTYELKVLECKKGASPRDGRQFCVVEYEVLAAAEGSSHKVGDRPSHLVMATGLNWLGDIKGMVSAILNVRPEQVDEAGVELFFGERQPGVGKIVRCRAWHQPTKAGKTFTKVRYEAASSYSAVA